MSDPVVEVIDLDTLAAAVMPDVIAAMAAAYSSLPTVDWEVSTRGLPENKSPPRVVWVPADDQWGAPQKRTRGGGSTGKSVATCHAGVILHCGGTDRPMTFALVCALVRSLRTRTGGADEFLKITRGAWMQTTGATTLGEAYQLAVSVAIDVPQLPDPPRTARPTGVALDATRSTTGDGLTDADETG